MLITILVILLILALFGGWYGNGRGYGYWGWSPVGVIVLIILVLWLTGAVHAEALAQTPVPKDQPGVDTRILRASTDGPVQVAQLPGWAFLAALLVVGAAIAVALTIDSYPIRHGLSIFLGLVGVIFGLVQSAGAATGSDVLGLDARAMLWLGITGSFLVAANSLFPDARRTPEVRRQDYEDFAISHGGPDALRSTQVATVPDEIPPS
jgi:hypothetical protein